MIIIIILLLYYILLVYKNTLLKLKQLSAAPPKELFPLETSWPANCMQSSSNKLNLHQLQQENADYVLMHWF